MTASSYGAVPPAVLQLQRVDQYDEIVEIMRSPDFVQGGFPERRHFFRDTVIHSDGPRHIELKRNYMPLFSKEAMTYYETQLLDPVIAQVLRELAREETGAEIVHADLVPLIRIMLHRISAAVAGVDGVDTPERTERFRQLVAKLGDAASSTFARGDKAAVIAEGQRTVAALVDEFMAPSLHRRRELAKKFQTGQVARTDLPRDVLMMICLKGEDVRAGDTDYEAYVWRECMLFLHAATQTTTHALPHVPVHIHDWLSLHAEDRAKLTDAEFLHRAVEESLRLHQASPVRFRTAAKDVTLSTGRKVAAHEMVALWVPEANVDTAVFGPDARAFNPNRPAAEKARAWGLTFGAGVHMCMGSALVTGLQRGEGDTEGTMVKILKSLYARGMSLDPARPPKRIASSFHDSYESVPIVLRRA